MSKTEKNLMDTFAGESHANRKYLAFAKKPEQEGLEKTGSFLSLFASRFLISATNFSVVIRGLWLYNLESTMQIHHKELRSFLIIALPFQSYRPICNHFINT